MAFFSGLSEPSGALLGFIILVVLETAVHEAANGVLFGFVAGMMVGLLSSGNREVQSNSRNFLKVYISVKELLPTARRYDPDDKITSYAVFAGMLVMALSLVLFLFA